jgi:hypothetical protein
VSTAAPPSTQPKSFPSVTITIYAPKFIVEKGKPLDLVLEMKNERQSPLVVSNVIHLSRTISDLPGIQNAPEKEVRVQGKDGMTQITINCEVASQYSLKIFSDIKPKLIEPITVAPESTYYLKICIPGELFEVGDCSLVAFAGERNSSALTICLRCVSVGK